MLFGNTVLAYTHIGYVVAGWAVTAGAFGAYGVWLVRRGRKLSEVVPPEDRRWS